MVALLVLTLAPLTNRQKIELLLYYVALPKVPIKGEVVISELVKFFCLSNPLELRSDHFPAGLCRSWGIKKDPTIWLDGARPPPKYVFKNFMCLANSKI